MFSKHYNIMLYSMILIICTMRIAMCIAQCLERLPMHALASTLLLAGPQQDGG